MDHWGVLLKAIRDKDISAIENIFLDKQLKRLSSDCRTETELWDYKVKGPDKSGSAKEWAETSKDVLSFYNTGKGGLIIFGVENDSFYVSGISKTQMDSKIFNDKIRPYIGDKIWVEYYKLEIFKDIYIGIAVIPPSQVRTLQKFVKNGPEKNKKCLFLKNGSAIRSNDSSRIYSPIETDEILRNNEYANNRQYEIDEHGYRLLSKDYFEFIERPYYCQKIQEGLNRGRVAVVALTGIGGVGKTALATWAVKEAYKNGDYDYIISITAKDRELLSTGILPLDPVLTNLNDLLDAMLEVIGFSQEMNLKIEEKEKFVKNLVADGKVVRTLLYIDNLETTSDPMLINFINDLPEGVKAIVTSRRNMVQVSSYPIEINVLEDEEIIAFIDSLSKIDRYSYCRALSNSEKEMIGLVCNKIPLAVKWVIGRCSSIDELLAQVNYLHDEITGGNNEQLLEFVFRRIFESMTSCETEILKILSVTGDVPLPDILVAIDTTSQQEVLGVMDNLERDTLIIRYFDKNLQANKFKLMPFTRAFVIEKLLSIEEERKYKKRLDRWYNAEDISDIEEKQLVREMRRSGKKIGETYILFAKRAILRGDISTAESFYKKGVERDSKNWKVHKAYGEYLRHYRQEIPLIKALSSYERAINLVNRELINSEIAILYREYAMLYRQSGRYDSENKALEYLEKAYEFLPNDPITANLLARIYFGKGQYTHSIELLIKHREASDKKTKEKIWPLLFDCYSRLGNQFMVEKLTLKHNMDNESIAYDSHCSL